MITGLRIAAFALLALALPGALLAQDGREGRRNRASIRLGGSYMLGEGTVVRGPLLIIGGSARLDGTVEDDVTTVGGSIDIGPTAVIEGDLNVFGGTVTVAPGAQIAGEIDEVTADWGDFPIDVGGFGDRAWTWFAAWLTVLRLSFVFVAGLLLALLGPHWMQSIGTRVTGAPGWSLAAGIATELLITPAVAALSIALVITIVGIPLLAGIPVLLAVLALLWVAGFTAVAIRLGGAMRAGRGDAPVRQFLLGFVAICGATLISQVLLAMPSADGLTVVLGGLGLAIEYVAWTLGLGAALLTAFNRGGVVPPPLPPQAAPQFVP